MTAADELAEAERRVRTWLDRHRITDGPVPLSVLDVDLRALLAEYDRRGQIEQRAIGVATHPEGVATKSLAARSRTRRNVACHILGWQS